MCLSQTEHCGARKSSVLVNNVLTVYVVAVFSEDYSNQCVEQIYFIIMLLRIISFYNEPAWTVAGTLQFSASVGLLDENTASPALTKSITSGM